jgi:hypothetical protein
MKKGIKTGREVIVERRVNKEKEMTKKQTEDQQEYNKI